jgi:hypothetical protein
VSCSEFKSCSHGASGYAKYALEFPLKDMIVCTDFQVVNIKMRMERLIGSSLYLEQRKL